MTNSNNPRRDPIRAKLEKIESLPHDNEAEMTVIGSMLIDNATIPIASERLGNGEAFHDDSHAALYRTIVELHNKGVAVEPTALAAALRERNLFDRIGGYAYLAKLETTVIAPDNIDAHVEIVLARSKRRRLVVECVQFLENYNNYVQSTEELSKGIETALADIAKAEDERSYQKSYSQIMRDELDAIDKFRREGKDRTGILTGFDEFDRLTGGIFPQDMMLIVARESTGKTAITLQIIDRIATPLVGTGYVVPFFSFDSPDYSIARRNLARRTQLPLWKVKNARLNQAEMDAIASAAMDLAGLPVEVLGGRYNSIDRMLAKLRRLRAEHNGKLGPVFVDYAQLIRAEGKTEYERMTAVSEGIRSIPREFNVPVICLAQLNRGGGERTDHRKPTKSDIKGTGRFAEDADLIVAGWVDNDDNATEVHWALLKGKDSERNEWSLDFDGATQTFRNQPSKRPKAEASREVKRNGFGGQGSLPLGA